MARPAAREGTQPGGRFFPAATTTMSHHRGVLGASLQQNHRPVPIPARSKSKRLRTKRERNATKFGPKVPLGDSQQGPAARPRWRQPPPWRGLLLGSPLRPPKPVVITQKRLCHRGLFNHEVKSLDVRRLLTPGPGADGPPLAPQIEEGDVGGVPAEGLKDLVVSLASLLGSFGAFLGRELVSERRRSLMAVLRRHRRGPLDLGVFLAHRTPAQPPGQRSPPVPRQEARSGPPGRAVNSGGWEVGDLPAGTPSPLRAVHTPPPPPRPPSPIFGAPRERENPFSWSSAKDEEDEAPGGLTQTWDSPGGLLPASPPFWRSPQPPQEEEGGDEGWAPIAPPAFSPDPPPWGAPQPRDIRGTPRAPRRPRTPQIWRIETSWAPPAPSRSPWNAPRPAWDSADPPRTPPRLLWELPDSTRAPPTPPRPSQTPQIWNPESRKASPDPLRPLWGPPNPSRPPWDPRPQSPDLPRAALDHPRRPWTPQLWNSEPPTVLLDAPRPLWDPPDAPRPLWGSSEPPRAPPDPPRFPRTPQLWSSEPPWEPPAPPRPPRDPPRLSRDPRAWSPEPPGAPQNTEPSRCCCHRLCRDTAQRDSLRHDLLCRHAARCDPPCHDTFHRAQPRLAPLCRDPPRRDPPHCCHQPPKRRRPDWGGVGAWGGPRDSPPSLLLRSGCRCPCTGLCRGTL